MKKGILIVLALGVVLAWLFFLPVGRDTEKLIHAYVQRDSALRVARAAQERFNRLRYDSAILYQRLQQASQIAASQQEKLTQLKAREKSHEILLSQQVATYSTSELDSVWRALFPRPDTAVYPHRPAASPGGR